MYVAGLSSLEPSTATREHQDHMNKDQIRQLQCLERAARILQANAGQVPDTAASGAYTDFITAVADLRSAAVKEASYAAARHGFTARKAALKRSIVRLDVAPIAALVAAYPRDLIGFAVMQFPSARDRDIDFLRKARNLVAAMNRDAEIVAGLGLPANVAARLTADVEDFCDTLCGRDGAGLAVSFAVLEIAQTLRTAWALAKVVARLVRTEGTLSLPADSDWQAALIHAERPAHRLNVPQDAARGAGAAGEELRPETVIEASQPKPLARIMSRARLLLKAG